MIGSVICLINRTPHDLSVTKDGKVTVLTPGENYVNSDLVRFARAQHPIPGTQNPYTLQTEFLVAVKGTRDPADPLPDELLAMLPKEKLDRTKMSPDKQRVTEKRVAFPQGRVGVENPTQGMLDPGVAPAGD